MSTWINGRKGTRIDYRDRGLQYGDGVFETMRVRRGEVRLLQYHSPIVSDVMYITFGSLGENVTDVIPSDDFNLVQATPAFVVL